MSRRGGGLAKKAFRLAKRIANHTEETKFFRRGVTSDVVNNATGAGQAIVDELTWIQNSDVKLFNDQYGTEAEVVIGNKYFHKRSSLRWEIHMDNLNNEEETCNFTVAVVKFKRDADTTIAANLHLGALQKHTDVFQGQAYFDRRYISVLYYKHFTLTMGGTSPGTSGQMLKRGHFKLPVNKMIRRNVIASSDSAQPVDFQDRVYFVVYTDNTSGDLENPRINYSIVNCIKDTDILGSRA